MDDSQSPRSVVWLLLSIAHNNVCVCHVSNLCIGLDVGDSYQLGLCIEMERIRILIDLGENSIQFISVGTEDNDS